MLRFFAFKANGPLLLCHAVGDDDFAVLKWHTSPADMRAMAPWRRMRHAHFRFMAAGHTHRAMVRELDGITILNPGTLKRDDDPCTAIVDLEIGVMEIHDLTDPRAPRLRETLPIALRPT